MFRYLLLLLLLPLAHADVIAPTIYEQKDLGPTAHEQFTYSISVDCTAGTIDVIIMDSEINPVKDANSYLKYIDFAQPLISTSTSDKDGQVLHKLPGDVRLMRGFFVLVIQKNDFRSKEIHFDIGGCYSDETPSPPSQPSQPGSGEQVNRTVNVTPPSIITPNITINISGGNETIQDGSEPKICPLLFLIPLLMFYKKIPSNM
jgi:hypothetical protein